MLSLRPELDEKLPASSYTDTHKLPPIIPEGDNEKLFQSRSDLKDMEENKRSESRLSLRSPETYAETW